MNLAPDELKLYDNVYKLLDAQMAKPDLVVYVRATIEVLAERLRKRNRDFERHISFDYLERVSSAYRDFFFYYDEAPLLVVDTSEIDFVANPEDLAELIREIDHSGPGTQYFVPRKNRASVAGSFWSLLKRSVVESFHDVRCGFLAALRQR
jgi:deoxyadenosine/deoxycytidine kinase